MNKHCSFVICLGILNFIIIVQILGHKPKPENCYDSDDIMDRQCCIFPPFFDRVTARGCGSRSHLVYTDSVRNVSGFRRTFAGCDFWDCMLTQYHMLDSEMNLILEKYYDHLEQWVNLNPTFSTVILGAKTHCMDFYRVFMPLSKCDFYEFHGCIRHYVNLDCPEVIDTRECYEWKQFNDECREYFL